MPNYCHGIPSHQLLRKAMTIKAAEGVRKVELSYTADKNANWKVLCKSVQRLFILKTITIRPRYTNPVYTPKAT